MADATGWAFLMSVVGGTKLGAACLTPSPSQPYTRSGWPPKWRPNWLWVA